MLLALVGDVDNTFGFIFFYAVSEGCHVRRVIVEATIGLLDHKRHLLLGNEDANGAIVLNSDSTCLELFNHWSQKVIVVGLTHLRQLNVHTIVDLLELVARELAEHLPGLRAVRITRLQLDDIGVGKCLELWISIEALFSVLVERLQVRNLWRAAQEVGEANVELTDEHTKLSTPITDMIVTKHIIAHVLKDAANAISLDCRTQVTNVHVLSNVRGREVDQNLLSLDAAGSSSFLRLFIFLLLLFGCARLITGSCSIDFLLETDCFTYVELTHLALNELLLQEDVHEETGFTGVTLASLR